MHTRGDLTAPIALRFAARLVRIIQGLESASHRRWLVVEINAPGVFAASTSYGEHRLAEDVQPCRIVAARWALKWKQGAHVQHTMTDASPPHQGDDGFHDPSAGLRLQSRGRA